MAVTNVEQFQITVNITAVILSFVTSMYSDDMEPVLKAVQLLWVSSKQHSWYSERFVLTVAYRST